VPLAFWLLAHASGALLVVCGVSLVRPVAREWIVAALVLFALALVAKIEYWRFVRRTGGVTLARAIGVGQGVGPAGARHGTTIAAARLLDAGHSKGTFLTREFLHPVDATSRRAIRIVALAAGFAMPLVWLAAGGADGRLGIAALLACFAGFCAERWLFFAEARHTVRLYHGEATT
jgi:sulfite dehydrogenase (quinone) subunit SoeC